MKEKILLCIPGTWRDRSHFTERLVAETGGRFVVDGTNIFDRESDYSCEFEIWPWADGMEEAFRMGSETTPISEQLLAKIGRHSSFLSLYSDKDGTSDALAISQVALAALDCGGLAVRVEGSKRVRGPMIGAKVCKKPKSCFQAVCIVCSFGHSFVKTACLKRSECLFSVILIFR